MSDYSIFAQANPGTDYPVKDAQLRAQLTLDTDKIDSAATGYAFGYKRNTTAGLNAGYYGGVISSGGVLTVIADATIALSANATNYVERTAAGVVSKNTVGFTAGKIPMFTAVTDGASVTAVADKRQSNVVGDLSTAGDVNVGGGKLTVAAATGNTAAAGTLSVGTGAAVGGATPQSGGVAFPATQVAVADPSTFDDYEEGTWTINFVRTGLVCTLTATGTYTKKGREVTIHGQVVVSVVTTPAPGNPIQITGIPFTMGASAIWTGVVGYWSTFLQNMHSVVDAVVGNYLYALDISGGTNTQNIQPGTFSFDMTFEVD